MGGGLGVLIYQNIDTIGHGVLIALIAMTCLLCFAFAFKHRVSFTWQEVENAPYFSDFALLGACVLFLILESYLQYQYNLFGTRYGLVTFIPAVLFFGCSYYFDHKGILPMAITALGAWLGVNIAPKDLLNNFTITEPHLVYTSILFGLGLVVIGFSSEWTDKKKHFAFTYYLFGGNLTFIGTLTALFSFDYKSLFIILTILFSVLTILHARQTQSYLLLLIGVVYGYIGLSYYIFYMLQLDEALVTFSLFYFFLSCGCIVYFLFDVKKMLGIAEDQKR